MKRLDDQWQQKKHSTNVPQFLKHNPNGNEIKASGINLDKNTGGIKQHRPLANSTVGGVVNLASGGGNGSKTGKTRYLGRMAVTSSKNTSSNVAPTRSKDAERKFHADNYTVQGTSNHAIIPSPKTQNGSFGPEYDEDLLCAMDKLEKDYRTETERIKSEVTGQMNFPNAKIRPEKIVQIIARAEVDLPFHHSPSKIHSIKSSNVKAVQTATTNAVVENHKQQGKALETQKLETLTFATPSVLVTDVLNGHLGNNAALDFSSTWETPLHVSTPANVNKGTGKHRRSRNSTKTNDQADLGSPKALNTKPREKTKLFQAILSSDSENNGELSTHQLIRAGVVKDHSHSSPRWDQAAILSATPHKNKQLPEQHRVTTEETSTEHQSPDTSSADDRLLLSSWGLPETILDNYQAHGISRMFEWQAECLCTGNALARGNLIYAAPTSAGKTMVAELLMLKCVLETKKKGLFILPFVSVAREKVAYLQDLFKDAGVRVDGYFGHTSPTGGFSSVDIAICTIEKANNLVNRLLEDQTIDQLGIVVVDELHMVGDSGRGYLLELLLTKLRFVVSRLMAKEQFRKVDSVSPSFPNPIQVVGMSATLPNLDLLAHWLNADLYRTDFRPVPLTEMVKIGLDIFDSALSKLRSLNTNQTFKNDEDNIIPLCLETIREGCSVLIFCPTKNWCEKLADTIAREFFRVLVQPSKQTGFVKASELVSGPLNHSMLRDVVEQLRRTPVGLDPMLAKMIPCGVAFHHAGLTFDERDIVEGAFRLGALKVLVATSTLSSGVNLPARRVIVRTPVFHGAVVDTMSYRQMIGRAGRKGIDTQGESILVCKASERHMAHHLLTSELSPVSSCLFPNSSGSLTSSMKRAILEIVVSKVASTPEEVDLYARCTMLSAEVEMKSSEGSDPDVDDKTRSRIDSIQMCISYLKEQEFIRLSPGVSSDGISTDVFIATQLGSAVVASGLSPDEGLVVFGELQKARRCFVLENELHTVYLVTPVYMQDQWATIDWYKYLCLWEQLPQDMKRVAELIGVQERFLARAAGGRIPCETVQQARLLATHKRFYSALVLHDLVNETALSAAVRKYGCTRGVLQSLQQSASTFAGMVTVFCNKLGWSNLEMLLSQFQSRLSFGVQPELVDLVRISLLNGQRARIIYNGGYATVAMVAAAEPVAIEKLLHTASPFLSKKKVDDEMDWELEERLKSRCIWAVGQNGLTEREAAVLIVEEARELLKDDLQHLGIEWKPVLKSDKATAKDTPGEPKRIAYNRRKTASKEKKNTSKKCENVGISLENSSSAIGNNRSVLTPPTSMMKLTQQRSLLKRDSLLLTSCSEGLRGYVPNAPVKLDARLDPDMLSSIEKCASESTEQAVMTVSNDLVTVVANDLVGSSQLTAHQKSQDMDSDRVSQPQSDSMVGVDEAMLIMSDTSNAGATMDWCPDKTLEQPAAEVLNGSCAMESANQSVVSLEHGHLDVDGADVADAARESMEISDTSLMLDTQTMKMITDAANVDRYSSKVQDAVVVSNNDPVNPVSFGKKGVALTSTADTPLLFSEADGDMDGCLFSSSFLTQKPIVCTLICAHPRICSLAGDVMNLRSVGANVDYVNAGFDANEQRVEPTFTNLVPLSCYERERCSGEGRYSEALFENDDSRDDDTVLRNGVEAVLPTANNGKISTRVEASSDDNIFANSDASLSANNSDDLHLETVAVVRPNENIETFLNLEMARGATDALITDSLTASIIVKMLADSEMQMSDQNESLFDCDEFVTKLNENTEEQQMVKASEQVQVNGFKHDIQNNVQLDPAEAVSRLVTLNQDAQNLSPEMESIMSALCGSQSRRVPKRSSKRPKSNLNAKNRKSNCDVEKESKRVRQSNSILEEQTDTKENDYENQEKPVKENMNQMKNMSSGSDSSACIPPTPPSLAEDASKTATPKRLLGGVVGTPKKPDSTPALVVKLYDDEAKMASDCAPATLHLSRHQTHSPGEYNIERDATHVLQQDGCVIDESRLISMTQSFTIIDVASNRLLFESFIREWRCRDSFSMSLACERCVTPQRSRSKAIGSKFTAVRPKQAAMKTGLHLEGSDVAVVGVAISWENCDVYYVSFMPSDCNNGDLDCSLAAPPLDEGLSVKERLESVKSVLEGGESQTLAIFDLKEQYKLLCSFCGIVPRAQLADVKVACWLMDPDAKEKNLHSMVTNYCPSMCSVLDGTGCGAGIESLGLTVNNSTNSGRIRASTEAVVVNHLMNALTNILRKSDLHRCFAEVEMPAVAILAKMELNGMGFSEVECDTQRGILQAKMETLENRAYQLAGHPFSLTSTDDVSQVLFVELRLPPTGDSSGPNPARTLGTTNRGKASRGRAKQSFSTSKDVLEKLKSIHPLPGLLLEWRRVSSALTKVVFPLQKEKSYNANIDMFRIYGKSDFRTSTGRVTMHEPNLQNIPKDFDIAMPGVADGNGEEESADGSTFRHMTRGHRGGAGNINRQTTKDVLANVGSSYSVSMRNSFIPFKGGILLAADYSQLELRIIAHLSYDRKLIDVLNGGEDVFKAIASQLKMVSIESVTTEQRQQAKQVCYGMIYGIGPPALAEQLGVSTNDASVFIETFKDKYTGMRRFLHETVKACRDEGYVKMISGRVRHLPAIKDTNPHSRAHAERQAVNSTVQGSAADLVKTAMIRIDQQLAEKFPETVTTHRHLRNDSEFRTRKKVSQPTSKVRGAYFILQLHDELIYEVHQTDFQQVADIIKDNMEHAMTLSVKLPVKLKAGPSWGCMHDVDI